MTGSQQLILGEGAGGSGVANYIEDVFSTWLYTGTGSAQTITNGIDLSTYGGLVWCKYRNVAGQSHGLFDTARGASNVIYSNLTNAQASESGVTAFNTTGFSLGSNSGYNANAGLFASWTFRKQAKFFDVVTWTGNGATSRTINHNLGSQPGVIIVKRTDAAANWVVTHRYAFGSDIYLNLNSTAAGTQFTTGAATNGYAGINGASDDTFFNIYSGATNNAAVNANGGTYVAYLFAHNAGGFGLTGTDNVISCGSFTTDGSGNATVSLGYEPQWALIKPSNSTGDWVLVDTMRSWVVAGNNDALLYANTSDAEVTGNNFGNPTATGFTVGGLTFSNTTYIYIAIRRGPMKTPTTGTSVFSPVARTGTGTSNTILSNSGFTDDAVITKRSSAVDNNWVGTRLIGGQLNLVTDSTSAEFGSAFWQGWDTQTGMRFTGDQNVLSASYIDWHLRRAPGFFDVVCYTGTGSATTQAHNLGVVPEMIIIKDRISATNWTVYTATTGTGKGIYLNSTSAEVTFSQWVTSTSSTTFGLGTGTNVNGSGDTYVAYLFASCPGVSKVGSYTGTGALQTINCGFTGGARFVLIKRTDSTGDWFVYDSARGITSGNDPYLLLNSTAAEVTGTNYVDTTSVGFQVTAAAPAGLNANGGTYIYLAIA